MHRQRLQLQSGSKVDVNVSLSNRDRLQFGRVNSTYPTRHVKLPKYYHSRTAFSKHREMLTQLFNKFSIVNLLIDLNSYRMNQAGITIGLPCTIYLMHLISKINSKKPTHSQGQYYAYHDPTCTDMSLQVNNTCANSHKRLSCTKYFYCMYYICIYSVDMLR